MSWLKKLQSENKYVVFFFLYIGFCISYIDRSAIGLSLPSISKEFNLAPTEMGVVISAFFIGYSIMQIPGGWLADHLGSKTVILIAMTLWSIFTFNSLVWLERYVPDFGCYRPGLCFLLCSLC